MCSILRSKLSECIGAACCVHGLGLETVSTALETLLWRVSFSDWWPLLGICLLVFSDLSTPPASLVRYVSILFFCFALWDSVLESWGVGPFFQPVRRPFVLQAPWREGYGGCCSQGCHGYPSHSGRSDSWPHLPHFRHHSPSLSIVMSLNVAKCNLG